MKEDEKSLIKAGYDDSVPSTTFISEK